MTACFEKNNANITFIHSSTARFCQSCAGANLSLHWAKAGYNPGTTGKNITYKKSEIKTEYYFFIKKTLKKTLFDLDVMK